MAVILFRTDEVYQTLADTYETLKPLLRQAHCLMDDERTDADVYTALRRLSYANMAAYLYQYHTTTRPLDKGELLTLDTFPRLHGRRRRGLPIDHADRFLDALRQLTDNTITDDGEQFQALKAHEFLTHLAQTMSRVVIKDACGRPASMTRQKG